MYSPTLRIAPTLLTFVVGALGLAQPALPQVLEVPNVRQQFDELSPRTTPQGFRVSSFSPGYSFAAGSDHHWQGITRHPNPDVPVLYMIGSRATCTKLSIVSIGSADLRAGARLRSNRLHYSTASFNTPPPTGDRIVGEIDIADNHAGGMQAAGRFLAIPSGSTCNSISRGIYFYDISNPLAPTYFTWHATQNFNAGILGFTQRDDGTYILAVTGIDNEEVRFFTASSALTNWTALATWNPDSLDTSMVSAAWPHCNQLGYCHQSLQLVNPSGEPDNVLYMFGFHQTAVAAPVAVGNNLLWLFKVTLGASSVSVQTQAIRELATTAVEGNGFDNGNFSAASGIYVSPLGEIIAYTTEHYINYSNAPALGGVVVMSEFASRRGVFPASATSDECIAHVELATDQNFGGRVLKVDALDYLYENYGELAGIDGGYANNLSSVTWTLPAGCICRLYAGANFNGNYLDLTGSGEYANLGTINWSSGLGSPNNNIQSIRFLGTYPSPIVPAVPEIPLSAIAVNILPGPCAMVKFESGNYPGPVTFSRRCELRNVGESVARIGGGTP